MALEDDHADGDESHGQRRGDGHEVMRVALVEVERQEVQRLEEPEVEKEDQ